jgi:hypothetical protein
MSDTPLPRSLDNPQYRGCIAALAERNAKRQEQHEKRVQAALQGTQNLSLLLGII